MRTAAVDFAGAGMRCPVWRDADCAIVLGRAAAAIFVFWFAQNWWWQMARLRQAHSPGTACRAPTKAGARATLLVMGV